MPCRCPQQQAREAALQQAHKEYLNDHPEVKQMLSDFISAALVEQPLDVFEFARQHFKGTATAVVEDAPQPSGEGGAEDEAAEAGDQDDLDDLDDMAADGPSSEVTAYLKELFESIDTDGSGSITKEELKAKLDADTELQSLLERVGADGQYLVLEQLDLDGDGEITWMEFEAMLGDQ